jgi:hypothetical protein
MMTSRLYVLGAGLPQALALETVVTLASKLRTRDNEFSLSKGRGILSKFTHTIESADALAVTYAFTEEIEAVVQMTPQEALDFIEKQGRIPREQRIVRPRITILECMLLKEKGIALVTKHYGRLRLDTVHDAVSEIVGMIGKNPEDVVDYGRGPSPKHTWIQHGLRFLNHMVRKYSKQELTVLSLAHQKGTRKYTMKDVTDLIRDLEVSKLRQILGLTEQNTVEVGLDWFQDPASRLKLGMKFDYRRGIKFTTNVMAYESIEQRAAILDRFAEEYQNAIGLSWTELLYRESLRYYFAQAPSQSTVRPA